MILLLPDISAENGVDTQANASLVWDLGSVFSVDLDTVSYKHLGEPLAHIDESSIYSWFKSAWSDLCGTKFSIRSLVG